MVLLRRIRRVLKAKLQPLMVFVVVLSFISAQLWNYIYIPDILSFIKDVRFTDDGYFYTVLARHFLAKGFYTFDGTMPTNGYHPLYLYLLTGLHWLFPQIPVLLLSSWMSVAFYLSFAATTLYFLRQRGSGDLSFPMMAVVTIILCNPYFQSSSVNGVEVPLTLFLVALTLCGFYFFYAQPSFGRAVTLGFVLGLLALSRLEMGLLGVCVLIGAYISTRSVRPVFQVGFPMSLIVSPYYIYNWIEFGSIVPISAQVKNYYAFTHHKDFWNFLMSEDSRGALIAFKEVYALALNGVGSIVLAAIVVASLIVALIFWKRAMNSVEKVMATITVLFVLAHLSVMIFLFRSTRPYYRYYFMVDAYLIAIFMFSLAPKHLSPGGERLLRWQRFAVAMLTVVFAFQAIKQFRVPPSSMERELYGQMADTAKDIQGQLPEHMPVGVFWPGVLGELLESPVIPLDGVIGSPSFFKDHIIPKTEWEYLLERSGGREAYVVTYMSIPSKQFQEAQDYKAPKWQFLGFERLMAFKKQHAIEILSCRGEVCLLKLKP